MIQTRDCNGQHLQNAVHCGIKQAGQCNGLVCSTHDEVEWELRIVFI